jgi:glyoxylase-like metal-dependent hydrolase (beta-lactamase superfamily II)
MDDNWTRRQFLAGVGVAAAAVQTLDQVDPSRVFAGDESKALFELKKVVDGVYAGIAAMQYKVNCNAAVLVNEDGVVVVDAHSKPSAARSLLKEIGGITNKPIRKLINTHFHWDHWQGNEAYAAAFPDTEIVASQVTRENMITPGTGLGGVPYIEKQLREVVPQEIAKLTEDLSKATTPEAKARLESNLQQAESYLKELQEMKPALPTESFKTSLTLYEKGREIQLHFLGRAHTSGDIFIYLPQDKVVITGDSVIDWMPFMNDGYPEEWIQTLNELEKLDFTHMILGHGEVTTRDHLKFFRGYLTDMIAVVKKASAEGATLDEMKKVLPDQLAPQYEKPMSKYPRGQYRERIDGNIEAIYNKVVKK